MTTAVIFVAGPMPPLDVRSDDGRSGVVLPGQVPAGESGLQLAGTLGGRLRSRISERNPEIVVAADGGLDLAFALGFQPGYVVGDMDSVTNGAIDTARTSGAVVTELPRAKDASDYELALDLAVDQGATRLVVVGGAAGRLDHVLATVMTLGSEKYSGLVLEAWLADNYMAVINGSAAGGPALGGPVVGGSSGVDTASGRSAFRAVVEGSPGDQVSLFALRGRASGVSTSGLRWPLDEAPLDGGTSLGVSNEMLAERAEIVVTGGCLAVLRARSTSLVVDDA